jgi:c(7)-type cytochrome triheme protein
VQTLPQHVAQRVEDPLGPRAGHCGKARVRPAVGKGRIWRGALLALGLTLLAGAPLQAEYGVVVFNRRAEKEGVRPVIFSHWFHRIRFRCKVCHYEFGFEMRAGANDVSMSDIIDGKFCGMCHDGEMAWSPERCDLCHSGRRGLETGIIGGHQTLGPGRW